MKNEYRQAYYYSAIATALWCYLILRAWYVPLVHDEVATFFHYIHRGHFLPYQAHWDANNHVLNSALSVFFYRLFGHHQFVLRLPGLLFFPLYAGYVFLYGKRLRNVVLRYLFWTAMLFIHNLLEFFALTRGYGMSMALMLAAIYHVLQFIHSAKIRQLLPALCFLFFALTANLTLINTALLIFLWLFISNFLVLKKNWWKGFLILLAGGGISMAFAAVISFELKKRGLLYYGEGSGFYAVTIHSLGFLLAGVKSYIADALLVCSFTLLIMMSGYLAARKPFREWFISSPVFLSYLMIGNVVATLLLHFLLGVNYPEDRTGMYFYFLLVLALFFVADELTELTGRKQPVAALLPFALLPVHFLFSVNFIYSSLWREEHYPSSFFEKVKQENKEYMYQTGIGGYGIQRLVWAYYNYDDGGKMNLLQTDDFPCYDYDYLIFSEDMVVKAGADYEVLEADPYSGLHLLKHKKQPEKILWREFYVNSVDTDEREYFDFYRESADSLHGESIAVELKLNISSPSRPFVAHVVSAISDEKDQLLRYQSIQLDWLSDGWQENEFHHTLYFLNIPAEARQVVVYLWNIEKVPYTTGEALVKVYRLVKTE